MPPLAEACCIERWFTDDDASKILLVVLVVLYVFFELLQYTTAKCVVNLQHIFPPPSPFTLLTDESGFDVDGDGSTANHHHV